MPSITAAGVKFLVYLFIMITLYFLLSSPLEILFDGFADADVGDANDQMASYFPFVRTAVNMALALGIAYPVTEFIFFIFSREPDYSRIRYR